jgi:hypothetical protein
VLAADQSASARTLIEHRRQMLLEHRALFFKRIGR